MERRLENSEALLPNTANSDKEQDETTKQDGGLSPRDLEALFLRLWQESCARDDNSRNHYQTKLADL